MDRFNLKEFKGAEDIWLLRWNSIALGHYLREFNNFSKKKSLGYYELKQHKPWFDEGCSNY
jgi:hypothetical protein